MVPRGIEPRSIRCKRIVLAVGLWDLDFIKNLFLKKLFILWFSSFFMKPVQKISTGSYDLNKWLYGGYESDVITMIAGPPGSGKTNFSILAACSQAKKEKKVIFIDTEGGFSVERVKQILGEEYSSVIKNFLVLEPMDFKEQMEIFKTLSKNIKENHVSLIVVDSIAMLYRLEIGDCIQYENSEKIKLINNQVAWQMKLLSEISRKQKIPIILTNQVYSNYLNSEQILQGIEPQVNIVGGDLFKYWSKCIIQLSCLNNKRKAILIKHRSLGQREFNFGINDKGIYKKSFIGI
jgi:DNA repair protein RadB